MVPMLFEPHYDVQVTVFWRRARLLGKCNGHASGLGSILSSQRATEAHEGDHELQLSHKHSRCIVLRSVQTNGNVMEFGRWVGQATYRINEIAGG